MTSFRTVGIKRPAVEKGTLAFQTGIEGTLKLGTDELSFADWRLPYKSITSGVLHKQLTLVWPTYQLHLSDGTHNYLFHIPRGHARALPLNVQTKTSGAITRLLGWLWVGALAIIGLMALINFVRYG